MIASTITGTASTHPALLLIGHSIAVAAIASVSRKVTEADAQHSK